MRCGKCAGQLRELGESEEMRGVPAKPDENYYECEGCGTKWTHNLVRNSLQREGGKELVLFTQDEQDRIRLAIGDIHVFMDGYQHTKSLDDDENSPPYLRLFMGRSLLAYLHGFYPADRDQGLLPVLRLVGFNKEAAAITQALDTPIGPTSLGRIIADFRNKVIAHPQFTKQSLQVLVDNQAHMDANETELRAADRRLRVITANLYPMFQKYQPELVALHLEIDAGIDYSPRAGDSR